MSNESSRVWNHRLADRYLAAIDTLAIYVEKLGIFLGGLLVLIVFGRVIGRYVFSYVPIWAPEISTYLAIWISLILFSVLIKKDDHLKVTLVFNRLSLKWKKVLYSIHLVLIFAFGMIFAYWGSYYSMTAGWASVTSGMGIHNFYVYVWIPIASVLIMLFTVAQAIEVARDPSLLEAEQRRIEKQKELDKQARASNTDEQVESRQA